VISPLRSNIYLHGLDARWTRQYRHLGTLGRYADDCVVMSRTKGESEKAEQRIREKLAQLGLELHPDKTRRVALFDGKEGFEFLGHHLPKRMSGVPGEVDQWTRTYFWNLGLHRLRGTGHYPERPFFWASA
jgi:hypothetical protein